MELTNRPRRLRSTKLIRELVGQTKVATERLIQPYFVTDGVGVKVEIGGMPGIYRESVDSVVASIENDYKLGLDKVMLFGVTDRKDAKASSACDAKNPGVRTVKKLKDQFGGVL